MITAKEAREKIDKPSTKQTEVERLTDRKMIEYSIRRAIRRGSNYCWINFYLSNDTFYWLRSLGYQIKRISSNIPNSYFAKIMW